MTIVLAAAAQPAWSAAAEESEQGAAEWLFLPAPARGSVLPGCLHPAAPLGGPAHSPLICALGEEWTQSFSLGWKCRFCIRYGVTIPPLSFSASSCPCCCLVSP